DGGDGGQELDQLSHRGSEPDRGMLGQEDRRSHPERDGDHKSDGARDQSPDRERHDSEDVSFRVPDPGVEERKAQGLDRGPRPVDQNRDQGDHYGDDRGGRDQNQNQEDSVPPLRDPWGPARSGGTERVAEGHFTSS